MTSFPKTPPNFEPNERPTCPNCGSPMWVTRIEPDDKRAFACPVCDISETANEHQVVASFSIALRHDSANEIDAS
jgi:DNA-directed RNA polymerase subunit M/transcription elongation factor TFIIS